MRCALGLAVLAVCACATDLSVQPEGLLCDAKASCPAGYLCVQGSCRSQSATCQSPCELPPAAQCKDASTLIRFSLPGACQAGVCSYVQEEVACASGCSAGTCVGENLCQNVLCQSPPASASSCTAGKAKVYKPNGACTPGTGTCEYSFVETGCKTFVPTGPKLSHPVTAVDQAPGSSGTHVLAVGPGGKVSKWNGSSWSALASGTTQALSSVYLVSATSGWITGAGGTLLGYDGTALFSISLPGTPGDLVSVHARSANHVLVAGANGDFWRFDGTNWTKGSLLQSHASSGPFAIQSAYVAANGDERLVGHCGSTRLRGCVSYFDGTTWYVDFDGADGTSSAALRAVGPSLESSEVSAFVGRATQASVLRHDSSSGSFGSVGVPVGLNGGGVAGISPAASSVGQAVYLLTAREGAAPGALYRFSTAGYVPLGSMLDLRLGDPAQGGVQALSRNDSGGVIVSDSTPQSASVFRRGGATPLEALELGPSWRAATFSPDGALVLMSSDGSLATRSAGQQRFDYLPGPGGSLRAVAVAASYALVVGANGDAYRVSSTGTYISLPSSTSSTFHSACAVSDSELYAVGDAGVIRSYKGVSFSTVSSPVTTRLLAVHCAASNGAVACGAGGTVVRIKDGAASAVSPAFPSSDELSSCWLEDDGSIWVAGDGVFAKLEGGLWKSLPGLPALSALQVIGPNEAYAVSSGSAHYRFDGYSWHSAASAPKALVAGTSRGSNVVFAGIDGVVVEAQ